MVTDRRSIRISDPMWVKFQQIVKQDPNVLNASEVVRQLIAKYVQDHEIKE